MELQRGFRGKLEDHLKIDLPITVKMTTVGSGTYDSCCFGVDNNEKLSDDRYMVFYNQPSSPNNEIIWNKNGNSTDYTVKLKSLPQNIVKLVFTVSIDGNGVMGQISSHIIEIQQNNNTIMRLSLSGSDFQSEKAIVGLEIYNKTVWRLAVVARGFNGGLGDLLKSYGGEIAEEPAPITTNKPEKKTVELRKGQKVNLEKKTGGSNELVINLNWTQSKGMYGGVDVDLDLECLYELNGFLGGSKGAVQAVGRNFGSFNSEPYIMLDGDDRSGNNDDGENLRINTSKMNKFKRILIYTSIYEGAANWAATNGVATIKCPGNDDVVIRLNEVNSSYTICAIAMLTNNGNNGFTVEKLEKYFDNKPKMDKFYNWGLSWGRGSK